jgi:hypothetical protein
VSKQLIRNNFLAIIVALLLVVPITSVYATTDDAYNSGYNHGCDDADKDPADRYINEPGKGPSYHTPQFMDGYGDGFDACSNDRSSGGSSDDFIGRMTGNDNDDDDDDGDDGERYLDGVANWRSICNQIDNLLSESCDDLVTSDGDALTSEGRAVLERIVCYGGSVIGLLSGDILAVISAALC